MHTIYCSTALYWDILYSIPTEAQINPNENNKNLYGSSSGDGTTNSYNGRCVVEDVTCKYVRLQRIWLHMFRLDTPNTATQTGQDFVHIEPQRTRLPVQEVC